MFIYEQNGKLNIVFQATQNPVATPDIVVGEVHGVPTVTVNSSAVLTSVPVATSAAVGGVKEGAAVTDATDATDVITQLNALLASLRTAGTIAT